MNPDRQHLIEGLIGEAVRGAVLGFIIGIALAYILIVLYLGFSIFRGLFQ